MDEYEAVKQGKYRSTRGKSSPGDYVHHKSHMNWPGIEPQTDRKRRSKIVRTIFFFKERIKKRGMNRKNKNKIYARVTPRSE